jgi:hypothetical protein
MESAAAVASSVAASGSSLAVQRGTSTANILPTSSTTRTTLTNISDDGDDVDYECPICYVAFDDEHTVIQCRNGHSFHETCLEQWHPNSESSGTNCPTCSVTMDKSLPIKNRFASSASKLAEEVKVLRARLQQQQQQQRRRRKTFKKKNPPPPSAVNVNQFAIFGRVKHLSEGFCSYVNKTINDFIQHDTAEQLYFSHIIVGACRDYIFKTGIGLGLLCRSKTMSKKKKWVLLTKRSEEESKKQRERRDRKNAQIAQKCKIRANSIQMNTDAGCLVKECTGKPKHWYCEHCVLERKYEDHIAFAHHLFSNKHIAQKTMSNRLKKYAENGELFVKNKKCLTFPIAQGMAATWKCKECNFTVDYDNPYRWISHKKRAKNLHAGKDIDTPKTGKEQTKKQASTKRKHVGGRDSVNTDTKRSRLNALMHYPCNTRVSMVWPDNVRYHGVVSKVDARGRHTVIWDEDQSETTGLKYSQLENI